MKMRPLDESEAAAYLAGYDESFPGAVETEHGIMVPDVATIGHTSEDGLLQIMDTGNTGDTYRVTVRELIGSGCWVGGFPMDDAVALAREAVPFDACYYHTDNFHSYGGCDWVTVVFVR